MLSRSQFGIDILELYAQILGSLLFKLELILDYPQLMDIPRLALYLPGLGLHGLAKLQDLVHLGHADLLVLTDLVGEQVDLLKQFLLGPVLLLKPNG